MLILVMLLACDGGTSPAAGDETCSDGGSSVGDSSDGGGAEAQSYTGFDWDCQPVGNPAPGPDMLPDCAAAAVFPDAADGRYREDCEWRRVWADLGCCIPQDELTTEGLLYAGRGRLDGEWSGEVSVVRDRASWDLLRAGADPHSDVPEGLPDVDFDDQLVVIVQGHVSSTCAYGVLEHGIFIPEQTYYEPRIRVRFEDRSGTCEACAAEDSALVIYATERARGMPIICSSEVETCG